MTSFVCDDVNSTREMLTRLFILIKSTIRQRLAHLIHDENQLGDMYELRTDVCMKKAMYYLYGDFLLFRYNYRHYIIHLLALFCLCVWQASSLFESEKTLRLCK